MTDTNVNAGGHPPGNQTTYNPLAGGGVNFPPGTPVVQSTLVDGTVIRGHANAVATSSATGIALGAGVDGNPVLVQFAGPLTLTAEQWDAITGDTGGLTRGLPYYLSPGFVAGRLTTTRSVTSGHFVVPMGIALSPTDLMVQVGAPVENP